MQVTGSNNRYFTYKCALVPSQFFDAAQTRAMLVQTVDVTDAEELAYIPVPEHDAVMIYVKGGEGELPEQYHQLEAAGRLPGHVRIVASYHEGRLYLTIVQGGKLLLCNSFAARDFVTAQYFIFHAMKKFQLNPEISTLYFMTDLSSEEEMSLYRYFKSVERI